MKYDIHGFPDAPPNPGRVVLLLGQSKMGPIHSPVYIKGMREAEAIFGPKEYGNLVRAYEQTSLNSDITVYLMRITGEYARGALLGFVENIEQPVVKFRSIYGGEDYNFIQYHIRDVEDQDGSILKSLVLESPNGINTAYPLSEFTNLQELVTAINVSTRRGEGSIFASTEFPRASTDCLLHLNNEIRQLYGGSDGLQATKDELYIALNKAYQILEGFEVDVVYPVPARFNDAYPGFFYGQNAEYGEAVYGNYAHGDFLQLVDTENNNKPVTFHEQLIAFCRAQQQSGVLTHGVMGLREVKDTSVFTRFESSYIIQLLDTAAFKTRYGLIDQVFDEVYDRGQFISVFGSDFIFHEGTDQEYYENGAAVYAGLIASTPPSETTTNQRLPDGIRLRHEFTSREVRELAFIGVTVARNSVRRGLVVANGVTAALAESELHSIANVRMVQYTLNAVNRAVDDLVGEPFSQTVIGKELHSRLSNTIADLKLQGILVDARFSISFSRRTSTGRIILDLLPKHSIEYIATDAMLQFNGRRNP